MKGKQEFHDIGKEEIRAKAQELRNSGWRLLQIGCSLLDVFEINYSFAKGDNFLNLKIKMLPEDKETESISDIYWCAFIYENEIHDLFGINFKGLVLDYQGSLYRTKVKWPFSCQAAGEKENGEMNNG